jgi:HSP20 family protein
MTVFDELLRLRDDLERVTSGWPHERPTRSGMFPPVNIYDNGESFLVRAELPGADRNSLDITVKSNQLVLRGQRVVRPAGEQAAYHRREREGGNFRRIVSLPENVDSTHIQATYKNGILEVVVPRAAEARPRRIEIG